VSKNVGNRGAGAPKGNQNNKKATIWTHALKRALARAADKVEKSDPKKSIDRGLDMVADTVVTLALGGDKDAWMEIGNRVEGKSKEFVELTVSDKPAEELTDDELLDIARGGGDRAAEAATSETGDSAVH
jgi:hypothetical protein